MGHKDQVEPTIFLNLDLSTILSETMVAFRVKSSQLVHLSTLQSMRWKLLMFRNL